MGILADGSRTTGAVSVVIQALDICPQFVNNPGCWRLWKSAERFKKAFDLLVENRVLFSQGLDFVD